MLFFRCHLIFYLIMLLSCLHLQSCSIYTPSLPEQLDQHTQIKWDQHGIPTIQAPNWLALVKAQGYVIANQRLWQMDLMRRSASGHLSEWFGEVSVNHDIIHRQEDWQRIAKQAYQKMPANQRQYLDAYTQGVNQFIQNSSNHWGIEYKLLNTKPKPWHGWDSILIFMELVSQLSKLADTELKQTIWHQTLPKTWAQFLLTNDHPWNQPLFGTNPNSLLLPPKKDWLPAQPLDKLPNIKTAPTQFYPGSNSWAWSNPQAHFLANDPHLGYNVPSLWFGLRLYISPRQWVVGVTVPGIPGIILGMNAHIAWALTNIEEDIDDYLLETISEDGEFYLARKDKQGHPVWKPIQIRQQIIKVKDQDPIKITAKFTHRGPLKSIKWQGQQQYISRQWLGFHPELLQLPTIPINQAKDWQSFNQAVDQMRLPHQNVLMMDKAGNFGYRASGVSVLRQVSGRQLQPALQGEWLGLAPVSQRHRRYYPVKKQAQSLATANERIWVEQWEHSWGSDERKQRLRSYLNQISNANMKQMQQLQRDTHSRYYQIVLQWLSQHSTINNPKQQQRLQRWQHWNGKAVDDPTTFTEAVTISNKLYQTLIAKVTQHFFDANNPPPPYYWRLKNAWMLMVLQEPQGVSAFGINAEQLANLLINEIDQQALTPYSENNRRQSQHPLTAIPVIGRWFRVKNSPQQGYLGLVRTELPKQGATTRLIWDLKRPENSRWSLTIGQSGHMLSKHYQDLDPLWQQGQYWPVFDKNFLELIKVDKADKK